ncbi:squamous cell carcinoma antigen recognized by T-cells 3 [Microplitis demolitor]|uniref:squamous cell carcinoma antigen recognized by T-cells 3 n=1 Tax=Microplitis demolitor TaxID=69319 RepID=UPI00043FFDF1|nr:squamous cell carcinoma antigen recognized by T-cells 3 [Microplitis demolitor]
MEEMDVDVKESDQDDRLEGENSDDSEEESKKNSLDPEDQQKNENSDFEDKDNSDSDDDDEDDEAAKTEINELKSKLEVNPYDYSSHLALIAKLQSLGELLELRKAREQMSSIYPLSPELWLSWLRDEISLAVTEDEKAAVKKLFERAVNDYLSPDIWLEYVQFAIGVCSTAEVRELFERALTATGLHVTRGAVTWEAYREYESILVSAVEDSDREEQINRVGTLFRRQLACPLQDMDKTLAEYQHWRSDAGKSCSISDEIVLAGYNRALADLEARKVYEDKLLSCQADDELYNTYRLYLNYEKEHGDPGRVSVLFERAITDLSLESRLWEDYIQYLVSTIKLEDVLARVYLRASRNVPWCSSIWCQWIRSLEKWSKPLLEIQSLLEQALTAGFPTADDYRKIWITFLEYLRRRLDDKGDDDDAHGKALETIRTAFNRAAEHLAKLFGLAGDPQCVVLQFWARTEAIHARDMERARQLWTDIMSQGHSGTAGTWLEYITLEKCYGDTKHLRKLFAKALAAVKDWPEIICNAWVDFERDEGTLEQLEICEVKTKERLGKVKEQRAKEEEQKVISPKTQKPVKRKIEDGKWKNLNSSAKVAKVDKVDGQGNSSEWKPDEVDPQVTVFVSNLDYDVTEQEIRDALVSVGPIVKFNLVKDFRGRSKGFAYIQLSDAKAVSDALKLDRTPVKGRPMFISRCDPDKTTRGTAFKYQCSLEKNKLFVKGLPLTTTKEELENIFKAYGQLKDVRLVTYRNGHSKGLAYVEFADQSSASKALLATDGMTIADKIISVAISQPPERKKPDFSDIPSSHGQVKSLGSTTTARTSSAHPKTMLSMVPRSVIAPSNGVKDKPKSNDEFRKMFLKK